MATVGDRPRPLDLPGSVQLGQQGRMQTLPNTRPLPLIQPPVTGRATAETKLDSSGLRIVCRAVANDVEPDAAETICDSCGKPTAYGVATTEAIAI